MSAPSPAQIAPSLGGVPETMLWALHNRASEAARPDGVLTDPNSLRIHRAIDYDYGRFFGVAGGTLAARAAEIDRILRDWISAHPDGMIVSLGEGLETQALRVDNGRIRWLSVDLPEAIRLREQFLPPSDRFRHIARSALDFSWMDAVDASSGVFIVAQGLLMYFQPDMTRTLFQAIAQRFPAADLVFDSIPRWFSRLTLLGLNQTPHYRLPPMPWGINRNQIEPTLRRWVPTLASVRLLNYRTPRGLPQIAAHVIDHLPYVRHEVPSLVHVSLTHDEPASNIITFRTKSMTTFNGVLNEASRHAGTSNELAVAAGQVIARRVALGVAAAFDPMGADHAEFGRMVPEKVEAFSAAGMIMLEQSNQVGWNLTRLASDEVMTTARATIAIATSAGPLAMAEAQGRFAMAWLNRTATNLMTMGMWALRAQAAAMVPIQQTVSANTARLER